MGFAGQDWTRGLAIVLLAGLALWGRGGGKNMAESAARGATGAKIPPIDASAPERAETAAFALG